MIANTSDKRLAELRTQLEEDPLCAATWVSLGAHHASRGEAGSAVAAFQKAIAIRGDHGDAIAGLVALGADASHTDRFTVMTVRPGSYAHVGALEELAETLHFGLLGLGFDCRLRSGPDSDGRTHIIVGGHLLEMAGLEVPAGSVIFNSEQIHDRCPWLTPRYLHLLRTHRVWDYSATNVSRLRDLDVACVACVPIGHVEELNRIPASETEDIDVVFAGSASERRLRVLDALRARGLRVKELFGVYGAERDAWHARAKIVLNMRFYDEGPFEIVRVSYLLSNGRFVVSETPCRAKDADALRGGVLFAPYDQLVDTCVEYAERADERRRVGAIGLDLMRRRPMRDTLREALRESAAHARPEGLARETDPGPAHSRTPRGGPPTMAALCCLYDDLRWLEASIGSVYSECDRIYFVVSDLPWSGPPRDLRATFAAIAALADPDQKIRVIRGCWRTEADQRNAGLDAMAEGGFDYCFVLDCDEVYDPGELREMKRTAFGQPEIQAWHMTWFTYWKSERFRIDPPEPFKPLVFIRVGATRFNFIRDVSSASRAMIDPRVGTCHHMSYARSDDEVRSKIASFSHAHEIVPGWYENVWLAWNDDPSMTNLHPTHPACYARAIEQPAERLPPILRRVRGSHAGALTNAPEAP